MMRGIITDYEGVLGNAMAFQICVEVLLRPSAGQGSQSHLQVECAK